jgi:hypothetical protein
MDMHKEYMLASLLLDSRFYLVLPAKTRLSFLSKLSERYSTLFRIQGQEMSEEIEVGYEASWTGVDQAREMMGRD